MLSAGNKGFFTIVPDTGKFLLFVGLDETSDGVEGEGDVTGSVTELAGDSKGIGCFTGSSFPWKGNMTAWPAVAAAEPDWKLAW